MPPGAGCCRTAALDVFTEVRFPAHDWALLVQSNERLEDRDLVLAAGLTCRTSNGCIEVVAGPQTERLLFCTLLADLLSPAAPVRQRSRRGTGAAPDRLAADAQPRPAPAACPLRSGPACTANSSSSVT